MATCYDHLVAESSTAVPLIPVYPEFWPPTSFLPACIINITLPCGVSMASIKLVDSLPVDGQEGGDWDGHQARGVHLHGKWWAPLPRHRSCRQELATSCSVAVPPTKNERSNVVHRNRCNVWPGCCHIPHLVFIPTLVDQVEHEAGGGGLSLGLAFFYTTTGGDQGGWSWSKKGGVEPSAWRERRQGAFSVVGCRIDFRFR